jgi:serine/threonine protein kinase
MANTTAVVAERLPRQPRLNSRYRIVAKLGRGSLGPVCVAEDSTTGSPVAIRLLPSTPGRARGGDVLERISPAIVAASRAHPALVRVLETGRTNSGRPFVVTEFVEGRRLSDVLASGPCPDVPEALAMALELGGAVETVHNMGLVHGALRTRNVIVLADGRVKLMDLELAGLRDAPAMRLAGAEPPAETPSAEQLRDEMITEKSDIYSFASIVYETLCGTSPFDALTADAAAARQAPQRPAWPRDSRAKIPHSVRRIIEDALSEEPQRRPFMSELLNGLLLKPSVTAGVRRRVVFVNAAAAAAVGVALLGWGVLTPRETLIKGPVYGTRLVPPTNVAPAPTVPTWSTVRESAPPTPARTPSSVSMPSAPVSGTIAVAPEESAMPRRESRPGTESTPSRRESATPATAAVPTHRPTSTDDEDYDPGAVIDWVLHEFRR